MNSFYNVLGLVPGKNIERDHISLCVNLSDLANGHTLKNDSEIADAYKKRYFIWLSGGGTYLLNKRYLLLVKRSSVARVNPDKYSLFTGRSDNLEEKLNPLLIARELFEELLLFDGNHPYKPVCIGFQPVIDKVYSRIDQDIGIDMSKSLDLHLNHIPFDPKEVSIAFNDYRWSGKVNYHVSNRNEVNILFLFSADIQIDTLSARDGEYYFKNGKAIFGDRSIYLFDITTSLAVEITQGRNSPHPIHIPKSRMTEHLCFLLEHVQAE